MNRKQFLDRLLEKAEYRHLKDRRDFCSDSQISSTPATIKRMKIYQKANEQQKLKQMDESQQISEQKRKNSYSNRKVMVLQKVKNLYKRKDIVNMNASAKNTTLPKQIQSLFERQRVLLNMNPVSSYTTKIFTSETEYLNSNVPCSLQQFYTNLAKRSQTASGFRAQSSQGRKQTNSFLAHEHKNEQSKSTCQSVDKKNLTTKKLVLERRSNTQQRQSIVDSKSNVGKSKISIKTKQNKLKGKFNKKQGAKSKVAMIKFVPIPKISAQSYIVCEKVQNFIGNQEAIKIHLASKSKVRMEVASLTKIMTCILGLQICEKFSIDPSAQQIRIGKYESEIGGTSARISPGDVYSLQDLFHGLMLPSGNDASIAIAVWGGKILQQKPSLKGKKELYDRFIQEMNRKARSLSMSKTTYANSHGLVNTMNRSCAHDLAILSEYSMRSPSFRRIVSTKIYKTRVKMYKKKITYEEKAQRGQKICHSQNVDESESEEYSDRRENNRKSYKKIETDVFCGDREVTWENTHKFVHENQGEYIGIKTGVTTAAGPCLSSCVITECGRTFFIIVLNCKKLASRFKETQQLKKWVYKKQSIKKTNELTSRAISTTTRKMNSQLGFSEIQEYALDVD